MKGIVLLGSRGKNSIAAIPMDIARNEMRSILPVPTLSVMNPPPTLPNRENHLLEEARSAPAATETPMSSVI